MTTAQVPTNALVVRKSVRRLRPSTLRPGVLLAAAVLVLIGVAAVWPGLLATHDPDAADLPAALAGPGSAHLLGTDQLGRDVFSRIVYGARPSLVIGLGATVLSITGGAGLGVLAASGGKVLDDLIMRITDVFLSIPALLLALLVIAVLGPGTVTVTLAIACAFVPGFTRVARAQAMVIRNSDYVLAAVTLGQRRGSIVLRHMLPNALPPILVLATVNVAGAIIAGASLSFLGLGPKPPTPEWGSMLSQGRDYLDIAWAMSVFPGMAVTVTVLAINVVGRDLQHRFEGRLSHGRL
ncbi:ABC transporter permease [Streptomyces sp. NPDC002920]